MPSGKHTKDYGKSPFSMGKSTISMAISNSYVCLPEGTRLYFHDTPVISIYIILYITGVSWNIVGLQLDLMDLMGL